MIQLITNEGGRLDGLRPLFIQIAQSRQGKLDGNIFLVKPTLTVDRPKTKEELTFKMIQEHSNRRGFLINCYCL